jgi:hypothetical protein
MNSKTPGVSRQNVAPAYSSHVSGRRYVHQETSQGDTYAPLLETLLGQAGLRESADCLSSPRRRKTKDNTTSD